MMRPVIRSFCMFVRQIFHDSMLAAICVGCIAAAVMIRFGIPAAETALCVFFQRSAVLRAYYLLFDLLMSLITPYMICIASAMMMLTEYDENMSGYLAVTPVGKRGYLFSRLFLPAAVACAISVALMRLFSLTVWTFGVLLAACLLTGFIGVAVSMFLFAFSRNRVEGMAMAKLSGLLMLGLPVPFFMKTGWQYLFLPLPSFWTAKFCLERNGWYLIPAAIASLLWLAVFYRAYTRKIS